MADQAVNPDIKLAVETISKKRIVYTKLYDYYIGRHDLKYSVSRLKKAFERFNVYFAQNWASVIVDSVLDRLILRGFDVSKSVEANKTLDDLWQNQTMQLTADDVHEACSVTGEGFIVAMRQDEGDGIDVYFNDPRNCHVFYDPENPSRKRLAAKMWLAANRRVRLVLYYEDQIEHYESIREISARSNGWAIGRGIQFVPWMVGANSLEQTHIEENPDGIIPVFHFQMPRASGKILLGPSELSIQDAVNKLFADMMVSAEFNTFVQRVVISQSDPGDLANSPGVNWWIPSGDGKAQQASVLELGGRSLTSFLEAIDKLATSLAVISRTPKHYFFAQAGDPSGDALIAMEAPLNKKTKKYVEKFSVEWRMLAIYLLKLSGIEGVAQVDIQTIWEPVETIQPRARAEISQIEVSTGIPLVTSLTRQGWSSDEITQMQKDKKDEAKMTSLAQAELDRLRGADSRSNDGISESSE